MLKGGSKFPHRWQTAIAALIAEPTIAKAAETANIARSTLQRWMRTPMFAEAYSEQRRLILDGVIARIESATEKALSTLIDLLDDDDPAIRARAAIDILNRTEKTRALDGNPVEVNLPPILSLRIEAMPIRDDQELRDFELGALPCGSDGAHRFTDRQASR